MQSNETSTYRKPGRKMAIGRYVYSSKLRRHGIFAGYAIDVCTPDGKIILEPEYLDKLFKYAKKDDRSFSCRFFRWVGRSRML